MWRLTRPYYRNGPSHRDGADVSFADIRRMFGFSAIQIGRWVTKEEQQVAANLFFDALCDLADILQVNTEVISLRGTLGLAFGVGGSKHASAHYDAQRHVLALAKNAGGGALAHEWFHAFDHYIYQHMFQFPTKSGFASAAWLNDEVCKAHPLNQSLGQVFKTIFLSDDGNQANAYTKSAIQADRALKTHYFALPQELAARAFEACIQEQTIKNAFLVQGTKQTSEAKLGLYPTKAHLYAVKSHFHQYFAELGKRLHRELGI